MVLRFQAAHDEILIRVSAKKQLTLFRYAGFVEAA
jgi:hypothetical protein